MTPVQNGRPGVCSFSCAETVAELLLSWVHLLSPPALVTQVQSQAPGLGVTAVLGQGHNALEQEWLHNGDTALNATNTSGTPMRSKDPMQ